MPSTLRGRSVFVVLLVAVLSALPMHGAWAHSALISSNPSSGSTIAAIPTEIELRFSSGVSDMAPALIVRHDNQTVAELQPRIDDTLLRADAPDRELPDGSYQLVWRIVSVDGHPLSGVIPFQIGDGRAQTSKAPATKQTPSRSSSSTAWALALGSIPIALLAVLFVRRRFTHPDTKEEQP